MYETNFINKLFVALVAFGLGTVKAQENVIKANPLGLAFGSAELGYERVLSEKSSFEIALAYSSSSVTLASSSVKATGFGAEAKYKFYWSSNKVAPRGWYGAPVVTYASASATLDASKGDLSYFGAGVVAGYQWVFGGGNSGFALDLNFGAQYISASS